MLSNPRFDLLVGPGVSRKILNENLPIYVGYAPDHHTGNLIQIEGLGSLVPPSEQVGLIPALAAAHPGAHFVCTVYSPYVLLGMSPKQDRVTQLRKDPVRVSILTEDPRLLSLEELYGTFFDARSKVLLPYLELLQEFSNRAASSEKNDTTLQRWASRLEQMGVEHNIPVRG
jgi:hypothetical protein